MTSAPVVPTAVRQRVVLLGASNLTQGLATILKIAQRQFAAPLEVYAALGHGRSLGQPTRVLGRELPGMLDCRLWSALERASPLPTAVLLTDIGNDLLYETPLATIKSWLSEIFFRIGASSD